tara:strand:+ start:53 stop:2485 length:2433 start_codon:yes stop_codon:yes gene_type:complete
LVTELKILNTKVDLFQDENIEVINSVLDIKDISKNTNSFTRGFTVPASANNNQLFKHYYDADINNAFDARTKVAAEILLDGISFKVGFIQLTKVNVKKNKPTSYSINFSGNLNGISKAVGDKKLKNLDLTAYNHAYNSSTVKTGLQSSVTTSLTGSITAGELIYNGLAKKQYFIQDNDNTSTATLQNIGFLGGTDTGIIWNDLKPSLKLIVLIEAIETYSGLTFSRHFFDTTEFQDLFMWLNPSKSKEIEGNSKVIDFDTNELGNFGTTNTFFNLTTDVATYPQNQATGEGFYSWLNIIPEANSTSVIYKVRVWVDGEDDPFWESDALVGAWSNQFVNWEFFGNELQNVYYEVSSSQEFQYTAILHNRWDNSSVSGNRSEWFTTTSSVDTLASEFKIENEIPDLKIIDFLKGLFSMFKLIVIPLDDGTYYINEINSYYAEGTSYDVTKYVDLSEWDVNRGKIFSEISFKFQEATTRNNLIYTQNNDRGFGDEELILREDQSDSTSEQLEGDSFTLELPFEQVIFERLNDVGDNAPSNFVYGAVIDESLEPVNPKPVIFYNKNIVTNSKLIAFIGDTGVRSVLSSYNNPLHASAFENPLYSTTFSAEQNIWNYVNLVNTLYTNHYANYITDSFNIKKREYQYTAYLPLNIITKLELNDLIIIKGSYYRINKFKYNLITGKTTLELINYFGTVAPGQLRSSTQSVVTDWEAKTELIYVSNLTGSTYNKVDISGDGTSWATVVEAPTTNENVLTFQFSEYTGATLSRSLYLDITNNGITERVLIVQNPRTIYPSLDFSNKDNAVYTSLITLRA